MGFPNRKKGSSHRLKFVNFAKLIFSANQIPVTPDETDAFFSRLIIINFPNQLLVDKADPSLVEKLTTNGQRAIWLIGGDTEKTSQSIKKGYLCTRGYYRAKKYDKYVQSSDPIRAFVEAELIKDADSS
jgi:putative DNA primase/helicase